MFLHRQKMQRDKFQRSLRATCPLRRCQTSFCWLCGGQWQTPKNSPFCGNTQCNDLRPQREQRSQSVYGWTPSIAMESNGFISEGHELEPEEFVADSQSVRIQELRDEMDILRIEIEALSETFVSRTEFEKKYESLEEDLQRLRLRTHSPAAVSGLDPYSNRVAVAEKLEEDRYSADDERSVISRQGMNFGLRDAANARPDELLALEGRLGKLERDYSEFRNTANGRTAEIRALERKHATLSGCLLLGGAVIAGVAFFVTFRRIRS